ncbi:MAG TPA: hypothetical protein VGK97_14715 [Spongiibacteraceae bacterium]
MFWYWDFALVAQHKSNWLLISFAVLTTAITYAANLFIHEWGHLTGALLTGSKVYAQPRLFAYALFHFDGKQNNARQFIAMSSGGFVAGALVIGAIIVFAPLDSLVAKLALLVLSLNMIATIVYEFPETWRVVSGAPVPTGAAFEPFENQASC